MGGKPKDDNYYREYYLLHAEEKKEKSRKYYSENKEKRSAANKAYREDHKEEIRAKDRERHMRDREKRNTRQRQYYQDHKEEARAAGRIRYVENRDAAILSAKENFRKQMENNPEHIQLRTRKRIWRQQYGLSFEEVINSLAAQKHVCALYAGSIDLWSCTIDHIVPKSRGGKDIKENYQLTHLICNRAKSNMLMSECLQFFKGVVEVHTTAPPSPLFPFEKVYGGFGWV